MSDSSPTPGSHLLGPHVVGQRVVIRRLLPGETGPSGGPAMTDVLGVCTSWAHGQATVRREDGEIVLIDTSTILSGKPVPPRPSIRHRVTPRAAQEHAFVLFPDLETSSLGDWTLRASPSHPARRANSVLAFGHAAVDDPVAAVTDWYAERGTRPICAVLPGSDEHQLFQSAGWVPESDEPDTQFLIGSVAHVQRTKPSSGDVGGVVELDESGGLAIARIGTRSAVLASGIAAYADDWVGFRSIEVDARHRRRGHATAIMAALVEWGAERGARTAYLQVLGDNVPALALYGQLGFGMHHTYRYLAN